MQYQHVGYRIKGLYRLGAYALRWGMPNPKPQARPKTLRFFEKPGLHATTDAYDVSRRTLYRWKAAWEAGGGNLVTLAPQSCAPKRRRSPTWPAALSAEIRRCPQRFQSRPRHGLAREPGGSGFPCPHPGRLARPHRRGAV